MKRTLTIILCLVLACALCACAAPGVTQPLPAAQGAATPASEPVPEEYKAPEPTPVPEEPEADGIRIVLTNKSDAPIPLLLTYNMAAFQMGQPSLTISVFELAPDEASTIDITAEDIATLEEQGYLTRGEATDGSGTAFTLKLGVAACQNVTAEDRAADVSVATFMGELTVAGRLGTDITVEWTGETFMQTDVQEADMMVTA